MRFENPTVPELAENAEALRGRTTSYDLLGFLSGGQYASPQIAENVQRLNRGAAAIVADIRSGLLGGPLANIHRCLTAVKICEQLAAHAINAVPLGLIDLDAGQDLSGWSINLIDEDSEIHSLRMSPGEIAPDQVSVLLSKVEDLGHGSFDSEMLNLVRDSFMPGRTLIAANARLFSDLLRDWGMIVFDPAEFGQAPAKIDFWTESNVLPVLAIVNGPRENSGAAGAALPRVWEPPHVTIADARTRRTLGRYHLDLKQLYMGYGEILRRVRDELPRGGLKKIAELESEVEKQLSVLKSLVPTDRNFPRAVDASLEKVSYQLRKVQDRLEAALKLKEQTAGRRIRSACNLLAPNGELQEKELAAIYIPLRYTIPALRVVYQQLDILNSEHQIIWMD